MSSRVEDESVIVKIKDQGKGIAPELLPSAQGSIGTLGVGLRGMSERMRQLEGTLELFSNESGTTIVATLPCIQCKPEFSSVPLTA